MNTVKYNKKKLSQRRFITEWRKEGGKLNMDTNCILYNIKLNFTETLTTKCSCSTTIGAAFFLKSVLIKTCKYACVGVFAFLQQPKCSQQYAGQEVHSCTY